MEGFPGLQFDPAEVCVGDVTAPQHDGVHRLGKSDDAELWGEIIKGRLVDYRVFSRSGEELATISCVPSDVEADPPSAADALLRPRSAGPGRPVEGQAERARPGGVVRAADGYVCAALSGGKYICWKM